MGKFIITKRTNGEYQFKLLAGNGECILTSEGYISKEACRNGIRSVQSNAQSDPMFDRQTATNGKHYFNLKAQNGEIIGTSELYVSMAGRENGILSVKKNSATNIIESL